MATTVLITGANRGIGRGLSEAYLSRPNHLVFAAVRDFNSPTVASLKAFPTAEGSSVAFVKIESTSETDADDAAKAIQEYGVDHLDIVIANSSISGAFSRIEGIDIKDLRAMFENNTYPVVALYKAVYPFLKKTAELKGPGSPKFVAITTNAASILNLEENIPFILGSYGASKCAVNYLVRRAQYETEWLTAFVVNPGFAQTDMGAVGAKYFGLAEAVVPVKDSVAGIMKHIDTATREHSSGKFFDYSGSEMLY
ncbi:uncharacterized protein F4822DRAFT_200353 [Hypoxylon trugodes]|uniref:uncharacterized protein n=1 Tax=Hypoxylon trugodes TaxID=326681 RepID=UPI0021A07E9D|nr:uncharacterized protein F4822DRAFT_200353 [Hypoxylon trugodes]KAI1389443.1 hypothetical protein F4822DRAFT_200353 [Hypoxylon trugodes]